MIYSNEAELKQALLKLAEEQGLEPTANFDKIVRAKIRMKLGVCCPCDANNSYRFCISNTCLSDIAVNGTCHCNCWKRKTTNENI